jgi:hypothetical protein
MREKAWQIGRADEVAGRSAAVGECASWWRVVVSAKSLAAEGHD